MPKLSHVAIPVDVPFLVFAALRKLGVATELQLLAAMEPLPGGFDADRLRSILSAAPPTLGIEGWTVRQRDGTEVTEWSTATARNGVLAAAPEPAESEPEGAPGGDQIVQTQDASE